MNLRIGINPITWTNDDLQYVGANIALETCLAEASDAGYDGIELGHKFPRQADELRAALEPHGLRLVSGWYSGQLLVNDARTEFDKMGEHLDLLAALGTDVLVFAEVTGCIHSDMASPVSLRPRMSETDWSRFLSRLSDVAAMCLERGIKLCFHHHMGTVIQTNSDIVRMMESTSDDVFLLLDTGHAVFGGANPHELARDFGARIGHLHCKDIRPDVLRRIVNRNGSFLDAVLAGAFTVPGDGFIDYEPIVEVLKGVGYDGWAVVEAEQDASVAPPAMYAQAGRNEIARLMSAA